MIKLKTLLPEHVINEAPPGGIGGVAAATLNRKNRRDEEPSSASDEFLLWVKYDALYNRTSKINCKLEAVEIVKEEEKPAGGGFFKKLAANISKALGGVSTITCLFSSENLDEQVILALALKNDKFQAVARSKTSNYQGVVTEEHASKFIKYLINQSKWKNEISENFPDIEKQLTPDSFQSLKFT